MTEAITSMEEYWTRFFGPGSAKYGHLNLALSKAITEAERLELPELLPYLVHIRALVEHRMSEMNRSADKAGSTDA